jgi:hypothetical protein
VVVWGNTQLGHDASAPYAGPKVLLINRRGIQHLAREAAISSRISSRP